MGVSNWIANERNFKDFFLQLQYHKGKSPEADPHYGEGRHISHLNLKILFSIHIFSILFSLNYIFAPIYSTALSCTHFSIFSILAPKNFIFVPNTSLNSTQLLISLSPSHLNLSYLYSLKNPTTSAIYHHLTTAKSLPPLTQGPRYIRHSLD